MPPPPKRRRFTDNETVLIEVGPGKTKFSAHKNFISDASTFFEAAFREGSDFKEKNAQLMSLPEDDVDTFDAFMGYIYSGEFTGLDTKDLEETDEARARALDEFVSLYVLADKIGAQGLKRQMVNKWLSYIGSGHYYYISRSSLPSLYENTMPGSALRKVTVAMYVWESWGPYDKQKFDKLYEQYSTLALECPELGADLVREMFKRSKGKSKNPLNGKPEVFYEPCMKEPEVAVALRLVVQKEVLYIRHKLKKCFLSRQQAPKDDEMPTMSNHMKKLEELGGIDAAVIRTTKINKVLKALVRLSHIPMDEVHNFRARSVELLAQWEGMVTNPGGSEGGSELDSREDRRLKTAEACHSR